MKARSNVDEGYITVRNDSSNDTSIPAMGKIKTYSTVTNGLKNNPEENDKEKTSKYDPW